MNGAVPARIRIEGRDADVPAGFSLFDCAERLGLDITNSCGKQGSCRECLVEVIEGAELLSPPSAEERHLRGAYRLACRARVGTAGGVISFRRLRLGGARILESGEEIAGSSAGQPFDPAISRDGATIRLEGQPIARNEGPLLGLAIDVGTTTVVIRLVDLQAGGVRATSSFENPQRFAGSDIMARIAYAETDSEARLQQAVAAYVNQAVAAFHCPRRAIYEVAVVGNSTMRDLFFGLDVRSLGQSPYQSYTERQHAEGRRETTSLSLPARRLGLRTHRNARAYAIPLIGSHVGADAAAGLLAIGAAREERLIALMDIGTNTEIIVGNRHGMLAASCPAGPAFEGGTLSCGMPAFDGAIESVRLDGDQEPVCRVIGDGRPEGICGSGLVDALSELLRTGRMTPLGRLGSDRFVLDRAANIYLSEADISHLAQAKAAQAAGWTLVMRRYGANYTDIERLYLAGGFASHLDVEAAARIGLIPPLPVERVVVAGNTAIEGATLALRSLTLRRELESFVRRVEHLELETEPGFFDAFVEGCQFKPLRDRNRMSGGAGCE